jgi:hypothetical protein
MPRGLALGGIGAGVAALLLVALFAGLLISHKPGHPTSAATPTTTQVAAPTATATTAPTATPSGPGVWTTLSGCANVPDGDRILYNAGVAQQKSGPTIVTLQRSDDCGATWTDLKPPQVTGVTYTTNVNLMTIFASPLNPDTAYLTLQVSGAQACPSTTSASLTALSSAICQPQFVTTDGGATWQQLNLPVKGVLGVISAPSYTSLMLEGMLRSQGSLLYGVVTNSGIGYSGVTPPGRLVVSTDGGVHWSSADSALAAQGYGIWDFAVTPTGSAIYVTAEPFNDPPRQPPTYTPTLSIWSSLDGGQTWAEGGPAPGSGSAQGGMVMFMSAGMSGNQPIAYIVAEDQGQARMLASVNGGHTWQEDTQLHYADTGGDIFELLGTLPDGSVVIEQPAGGGPTLAWKPGSAQRAIAQNARLMSYFAPIFQQRTDGLYLWLTGYEGTSSALSVTYTQLQV